MPYKERDPFHKALRSYLQDVSPTIATRSAYLYKNWIERSGSLLNFKDPRKVDLRDMVWLESRLIGSETTVAIKAAMFRTFLRWCGNKDAQRWKVQAKQRPKTDGVFLTEDQIAVCHHAAGLLGIEHALILSLAVDNGLRCIDMLRLTMRNVQQLISSGQSMIQSKGRRGGKMRLMVMSQATFPILEEYMIQRRQLTERYKRDPALLLIREDTKLHCLVPMTYEVVLSRMKAVSTLSGVYFRPHDGRRTFGNRHHRSRTDLETIAALMGHSRIDQTFRSYIGITAQEMREAQDRLCPSIPIQSVSTI